MPSVVVVICSTFSIDLREEPQRTASKHPSDHILDNWLHFYQASTMEGSGSALQQEQRWAMLAARVSRILSLSPHILKLP
jgi:hypothetical protein